MRSLTRRAFAGAFMLLTALALGACSDDGTGSDDPRGDPRFSEPMPPAAGVGVPRTGILPQANVFMGQVSLVNLDDGFARVPLYRGTFNGQRVWYVLMDASDSATAAARGLNFAPRLNNADRTCPACVQDVTVTGGAIPGPGTSVAFQGTLDFSPQRMLVPGPEGFPPLAAQPGGMAVGLYSDLIRVGNVVFNAPIVATGNGPFDVVTHSNTHDRVLRMDTVAGTVDLLMVRAFAGGRDIMYFTFGSSDATAATIERAAFVPVMAQIPFANDDQNPEGARVALWTFVNGKAGSGQPVEQRQGLNHVIIDGGNRHDASLTNRIALDSLRNGGDARNVLGTFPTFDDPALRRLYVPIWDVFVTMWRPELVAQGKNFAQTDGNVIRQLAVFDRLTNPGGRMLNSAGFVVNCPPFAFTYTRPTGPVAPRPPGQP